MFIDSNTQNQYPMMEQTTINSMKQQLHMVGITYISLLVDQRFVFVDGVKRLREHNTVVFQSLEADV